MRAIVALFDKKCLPVSPFILFCCLAPTSFWGRRVALLPHSGAAARLGTTGHHKLLKHHEVARSTVSHTGSESDPNVKAEPDDSASKNGAEAAK